jgi:hypothetical protein
MIFHNMLAFLGDAWETWSIMEVKVTWVTVIPTPMPNPTMTSGLIRARGSGTS